MNQTKEQALLDLYEHVFKELFEVLYDTLDPPRQERLVELSTLLTDSRQKLDKELQTAILEGAGPFIQLKHRLGLIKNLGSSLLASTDTTSRCDDEIILQEIQQYFNRQQTGYPEGGPILCRANQSKPLPPTLDNLQTGLYQLTVKDESRLFACFKLEGTTQSFLILQLPHSELTTPKWTIWTYSEDEKIWINHEHSELLDANQLKKAMSVFAQQMGCDTTTPVALKTVKHALNTLQSQQPKTNPWYWAFSIDCYQGVIYRTPDECRLSVFRQHPERKHIPWQQLTARKQTQFYNAVIKLIKPDTQNHPVKNALTRYRLKNTSTA